MHPAPSLLEAPPKQDERSPSNPQTPSSGSGAPPTPTPAPGAVPTTAAAPANSSPSLRRDSISMASSNPVVSTAGTTQAGLVSAAAAAAAAAAVLSSPTINGPTGPAHSIMGLQSTNLSLGMAQQQPLPPITQPPAPTHSTPMPEAATTSYASPVLSSSIIAPVVSPSADHSGPETLKFLTALPNRSAHSGSPRTGMTTSNVAHDGVNDKDGSAPATHPDTVTYSSVVSFDHPSQSWNTVILSAGAGETTTVKAFPGTLTDTSVLLPAVALQTSTPSSSSISSTSPVPDNGSIKSNNNRRSRRRTGPLSQAQREKAAIIRKLGACADCRRRRVACHPNHHNMTWEEAVRKFRSHSPGHHELAGFNQARPISPAAINSSHSATNFNTPLNTQSMPGMGVLTHNSVNSKSRTIMACTTSFDGAEMDIDPPNGEVRNNSFDSRIRTPLPSGPRGDGKAGYEIIPSELPTTVTKLLMATTGAGSGSGGQRARYSAVQSLLLQWSDDDDEAVTLAINELSALFTNHYRFTTTISRIPGISEGNSSPYRWLSTTINKFAEDQDTRDVLKIVYYTGHSYLDKDRHMVLSSPKDEAQLSPLRWNGIQEILEEGTADTLILMDAAYFASASTVSRKRGVLEVLAAGVTEEHILVQGRGTFTKAIIEQLRTAVSRGPSSALTATELHARVLSSYPKLIGDRNPEREMVTSFPAPLHVQGSGKGGLPSVLLAPLSILGTPLSNDTDSSGVGGIQVNLCLKFMEGDMDEEALVEWIRLMPEGVKDVKVEGPYKQQPQWR